MRDYQQLLRDYFADPLAKPLRPKELAQELGLGKNDFKRFKDAVEGLVADGRLLLGKNKLVRSAAPVDSIAGTVKRTGKGIGYFRPHDLTQLEPGESLYIFPEDLQDAFTGDEVLVQLLKRRERSQRCGRVIEILSRGSKAFVGTYFEQRDHGFVRIDGNQFEGPISVGDPGAKGVIPEDRVVVEMLRFPSHDEAGEAVITKVLGVRGAPGVDLQTIIAEFELPDEFPEAVLAEARLQAQMFEEEVSLHGTVPIDARRVATVVPSPPSSGERARVRGPSGDDASQTEQTSSSISLPAEQFTEFAGQPTTKAPLTLPLSPEDGGEGTGAEDSLAGSVSLLTSLHTRLDLTNELIITIDPVDARDFDDAISLTREDDGNWRLGVHIADVAHFVRPGTLLDKEAHRRGTSVYLPDKVLPMLPEVISNALASLQQGRVRYTKSAFITLSPEGIPLDAEFANSKIKVVQRFAYEQVMPLVEGLRVEGRELKGGEDGDDSTRVPSPPSSGERARVRGPKRDEAPLTEETLNTRRGAELSVEERTPHPNPTTEAARGEGTRTEAEKQRSEEPLTLALSPQSRGEGTRAEPDVAPNVIALLRDMHGLAMILRKRRFARGALDLNLPEVKIDMTRDGTVAGAHRQQHDESHQIIEEFMLAANIAVATKLTDCGIPFLRRNHAAPDEMKLGVLSEFAKSLGYKTKTMPGRADLQKLLKEVQGTPHEYAISYATLRSMKQAVYGPEDDIGHYALAFDHYCHFTSPIRRYPDLAIHRLIDEVVKKESKLASVRRGSPNPAGASDRRSPLSSTNDLFTKDGKQEQAEAQQVTRAHSATGDNNIAERRVRDELPLGKKKPKQKPPHPNPLSRRRGRGDKQSEDGPQQNFPAELVQLGVWCSMTERRAQDAERELIKLKMLEYLTKHIGDELHATVTGVEKFGLFCTGIELPAEGLVHISTLGDDRYDYDDRSHTLVGRRSNRTFRLGDFVKVIVAKVDLVERKLEMRLVVEENAASREFQRRESQSRQDSHPSKHKSQGPPKKRGKRR